MLFCQTTSLELPHLFDTETVKGWSRNQSKWYDWTVSTYLDFKCHMFNNHHSVWLFWWLRFTEVDQKFVTLTLPPQQGINQQPSAIAKNNNSVNPLIKSPLCYQMVQNGLFVEKCWVVYVLDNNTRLDINYQQDLKWKVVKNITSICHVWGWRSLGAISIESSNQINRIQTMLHKNARISSNAKALSKTKSMKNKSKATAFKLHFTLTYNFIRKNEYIQVSHDMDTS